MPGAHTTISSAIPAYWVPITERDISSRFSAAGRSTRSPRSTVCRFIAYWTRNDHTIAAGVSR